jgi:tetratricopeptide (TPR) repeat protein
MALAKSGQDEDKIATRYYKNAIKYDRHMYPAYVTLGQTYIALGEVEDAQKLLKKLEKVKAKCKDDCDTTRLDAAHADLKAVVEGSDAPPGDQSSLLFDRIADPDAAYLGAVALINGGQFQAAIVELTDLLEAVGPHADVLNYLGYSHRKMGYFNRALGYYRQALAVNPYHRGAHEYLGELFIQTGQRAKAARQLDRLAGLCPFGCAEFDDLQFKFNSMMQAAD